MLSLLCLCPSVCVHSVPLVWMGGMMYCIRLVCEKLRIFRTDNISLETSFYWWYSQVQDRNGGWGEMYKNVVPCPSDVLASSLNNHGKQLQCDLSTSQGCLQGEKWMQLTSNLVQGGGEEIYHQGGDFPQIYGFKSYVFYKSFLPCAWITSTIRPRCLKIFDVRTSLQ